MTIAEEEPAPGNAERLREIEGLRRQLGQSEGQRIYAHLMSYLRTVDVWQGFADNIVALLTGCEHNEQMMAYAMSSLRQVDPRDSIISSLDSGLVAYAAGVGAVVDQTRVIINKYGDEATKREFERRRQQMEESVPSTPFLVKLRNYVLHYLSAPWGVSFSFKQVGAGQEVTLRVQLHRDELLKMDSWSRPARTFLEDQESDIHVTPLIEAFTRAEADLCAWVHTTLQELKAPEIEATNNLIRQYNLARTGGAHDGSDWDGFYDRMSKNTRHRKTGEPQLDRHDAKAEGDAGGE